MQRLKNIILAVIIVSFFCNCETQVEEDRKEVQEIFTFLINNKAVALPPAPPNEDAIKDLKISKEVIDSLKRVKLNIAVYPKLEEPRLPEKFNFTNLPIEFSEIVKKFSSIDSQDFLSVDSINSKSRHNIVKADTTILSNSKDWKKYDLLFKFSNISFNKTYNKAALTVGISKSALWGYGQLYLLSKDINNEWRIVDSFQLESW